LNHTAGTWYNNHYPITGSNWSGNWELLPADYSYFIDDYTTWPWDVTIGARAINFRIIPGGYVINSGPNSAIINEAAALSVIADTGEANQVIIRNIIIGANEVVQPTDPYQLALLRCIGAFGGLTFNVANADSGNTDDYSIGAGLIDFDGNALDGSIYHNATVWHKPNNRVYSLHYTWPNSTSRIIAVDPVSGGLLYQYPFEEVYAGGPGSFTILGDYVYVWQTAVHSALSTSAIVKLTLDLEFICIEDCSGAFDSGVFTEIGRSITNDGNEFIYNFASAGAFSTGVITKYQVAPVNPGTSIISFHNPVWPFTKQWNKI
jgi:hypothetical protein